MILVEDESAQRRELVSVLQEEGGIAVVEATSTAARAIELVEQTRPDVVVLDLHLGVHCSSARVVAAEAQVPGADTLAELGSLGTPDAFEFGGDVTHGRDDQSLVATLGVLTELLARPGEDLDDVCLA